MSDSIRSLRLLATFFLLGTGACAADPLTIDLTRTVPEAEPVNLGQGTNKNPEGHTISADNRSLFLDGKRWTPVVGEFHYSRYPADEWRDELLKMKAGGITVVSTYVFWIHQEEEQGKFDWRGRRSLGDFLKLCKDVRLLAIVRMGPWDHGEARNGGFPDWVVNGTNKISANKRMSEPALLDLVEPFFRETAAQMKGLLWKDGGPVIGVQMDNECSGLPYLFALKKMAQDDGVDVPLYTMTGWNGVAIPTEGLLPLFGAYSIGFWGGTPEMYRKVFVFSDIRDDGDLGAQMENIQANRSKNIDLFPYACCEIGAGMMSSYNRRIKIVPDDIAAMALIKIGCGSNMQGYYMYQGGNNPDSSFSSLNEQKPNPMPFKDYDFQAPLGAAGEVREHYYLLREQHLFLQDFGPTLARTLPIFPDARPQNLEDFDTLRWDVRWDGNAGYLFFSNRQPTVPLPDHPAVQFALKTTEGTTLIPSSPVAIASGSYGLWPINLDCDGVKLDYATAQPLCRIRAQNAIWYFFSAIDGIPAEISLSADPSTVTVDAGQKETVGGHLLVDQISPGLNRAVSVATKNGGSVNFVVLTSEQAKELNRVPFDGSDHLVLTRAAILVDGAGLRLQATATKVFDMAVFPPIAGLKSRNTSLDSRADGIFTRFTPAGLPEPRQLEIKVSQVAPAGPTAASLKGMDEATWNDAAVYQFSIPAAADGRRVIMRIHYIGDAARIYIGDKLFDDHFYNGDPFSIPLWRIPSSQWSGIRLKILPNSDALAERLPPSALDLLAQAKTSGSLDQVTVDVAEQLELGVSPASSSQ